ncbi:MAG: HD domain-containing protein [Chitinivibrionales bacterium]|nr:HD domain-containing protein [Chitinivibrionales bacterium]MBD3395070.1 HD domain-containing protein [Chitinivibrionales bacterium]
MLCLRVLLHIPLTRSYNWYAPVPAPAGLPGECGMAKRINIDDVTPGMFLEDVLDARGRLLYTENTRISDAGQIDRLRQRGITHVYINTDKGIDDAAREEAYYREIARARLIHDQTFATVRDTLTSARVGKSFSAKNVEQAAEEIVESIMRNPDALVSLCQIKGHDEYTYEHSLHVGILVSSLAHEMEYPPDEILQVSIGGLLHDIGKMRVPEPILNKPGKYDGREFAVMKRHPEHGLAIVKEQKASLSDTARAMIGQHHERYNGSGYPVGLSGKRIHEAALISGVADVYDALTTDRVYREAWTPQKALATIFQGCDREYSRKIVERFTKHLGIYPVGSFVRLASGELGVVTRVNAGHIMAPEVIILFDKDGRRLTSPACVDLYQKQKESGEERFLVEISVDPKPYNVKVADYISKG